jgi:hypothetical protein
MAPSPKRLPLVIGGFGTQNLELGLSQAEAQAIQAGGAATDWRLAERQRLGSGVDRHRHYQASAKMLQGRDPMVVRRWLREAQRTNGEFLVVFDAVLENTPNSLALARKIVADSKTPNITSPWGSQSLYGAAEYAITALRLRA